MLWSSYRPYWFVTPRKTIPVAPPPDPIAERLRAAVSDHARAKAESCRCYQTRVQGMIDELFRRMEEGQTRHDP